MTLNLPTLLNKILYKNNLEIIDWVMKHCVQQVFTITPDENI